MLDDLQRVARTYWEQFIYVLPRLAIAVIVMVGVWILATRLRSYFNGRIQARSHDPLLATFLTQIGRWVVVFAGLLIALQIIGVTGVVGGLLGGLGLSAFLVGFAFKDIAENFLAGVILAFNRPFEMNDSIEVSGLKGKVKAMNLRTTVIKTYDGKDIFVPNSIILKEPLSNFTRDGGIRMDFVVGIDYDADPERVIAIIMEELGQEEGLLRDSLHESFAVTEELDVSTINVRVFFWIPADQYRRGALEGRSRLINRIKTRLLATDNVSLPSNVQEVYFPKGIPALQVVAEDMATLKAAAEKPEEGKDSTPAPGSGVG